jgi:homogentisate 1,2-dioxygenase
MIERLSFGSLPDKPHTVLRGSGGTLHYEECFTRRGFDGAFSILYHAQRPHISEPATTKHGFARPVAAKLDVLKRRHFRSDELANAGAVSGAPLDVRTPILFNRDVVVGVAKPTASDPVYFSNSDGDDVFFIREGAGQLVSPFGDLAFVAGDYVVVPRGLIHRFEIDTKQRQTWLSIECLGGVGLPAQHRNEVGQLRMDAPYSHRDFKAPTFTGPRDDKLRHLVIKREGRFHGHTLGHNPFDVVGWDGAVYPFVFPILKFQPRAGSVHLPPTIHGTFAARGALICSFVPRMLDFGKDAIPCPYPHTSVDVDEAIYYCDGQFSSRKDVGAGSISLHPAGITHGPHKGAYEESIGVTRTEELAVMLDCFAPLQHTEQAVAIEDTAYHTSF